MCRSCSYPRNPHDALESAAAVPHALESDQRTRADGHDPRGRLRDGPDALRHRGPRGDPRGPGQLPGRQRQQQQPEPRGPLRRLHHGQGPAGRRGLARPQRPLPLLGTHPGRHALHDPHLRRRQPRPVADLRPGARRGPRPRPGAVPPPGAPPAQGPPGLHDRLPLRRHVQPGPLGLPDDRQRQQQHLGLRAGLDVWRVLGLGSHLVPRDRAQLRAGPRPQRVRASPGHGRQRLRRLHERDGGLRRDRVAVLQRAAALDHGLGDPLRRRGALRPPSPLLRPDAGHLF